MGTNLIVRFRPKRSTVLFSQPKGKVVHPLQTLARKEVVEASCSKIKRIIMQF